jgi:predicted MPP superfamily phosphohydrolase
MAFGIATGLGWLLTVAAALVFRGRFFATFAAIILGIEGLSAVALFSEAEWLWPIYAWLHAAVFLHFGSLIWARMRPFWWRLAVSVPGSFFAAGTTLAIPWAVAAGLGFDPIATWLPFALAGVGIVQSLRLGFEEVDVRIDGETTGESVARHPKHRGDVPPGRPLRVVQISDPHLGPFMSVRRLRSICERAVSHEPDLILLTGDFLTMESQFDPSYLHDALAPLAAAEGRVFACFGNHDHEAPDIVRAACRAHGVRLLVDDEALVETEVGPVQIIGSDFAWRGRGEHLRALTARFPRRPGHLRVVLLHDPGAFKHLPEGEGDIVFSGHTHGGQVGLLSLGLSWTFVSGLTSMPDHGLWARGRDRLYVHRGTGHYGFPLRLGVPAEESVIRLWLQ